jgi:hypothetical protein
MNYVKSTIAVLTLCWVAITLAMTMTGLMNISTYRGIEECKKSKTRIEYVFPGFEFGCWLGSAPEGE